MCGVLGEYVGRPGAEVEAAGLAELLSGPDYDYVQMRGFPVIEHVYRDCRPSAEERKRVLRAIKPLKRSYLISFAARPESVCPFALLVHYLSGEPLERCVEKLIVSSVLSSFQYYVESLEAEPTLLKKTARLAEVLGTLRDECAVQMQTFIPLLDRLLASQPHRVPRYLRPGTYITTPSVGRSINELELPGGFAERFTVAEGTSTDTEIRPVTIMASCVCKLIRELFDELCTRLLDDVLDSEALMRVRDVIRDIFGRLTSSFVPDAFEDVLIEPLLTKNIELQFRKVNTIVETKLLQDEQASEDSLIEGGQRVRLLASSISTDLIVLTGSTLQCLEWVDKPEVQTQLRLGLLQLVNILQQKLQLSLELVEFPKLRSVFETPTEKQASSREYCLRFSDGFTSESLRAVDYRQCTKEKIDRYLHAFYFAAPFEYKLEQKIGDVRFYSAPGSMTDVSRVLDCCKLRLNSLEVLKQFFAGQTRLDKGTRDCVAEILDAIQVNILRFVPLYCCQALRLVVQQTYVPTPAFYGADELHAALKNMVQLAQTGLQVDVAARLVPPFRLCIFQLLLTVLLDSQARARTISTTDYVQVYREFDLIARLLPCAKQSAQDAQAEQKLLGVVNMLKLNTSQLVRRIAQIGPVRLAEMARPKAVLDMEEPDLLVRVLNLRRYCDEAAHKHLHALKKEVQ